MGSICILSLRVGGNGRTKRDGEIAVQGSSFGGSFGGREALKRGLPRGSHGGPSSRRFDPRRMRRHPEASGGGATLLEGMEGDGTDSSSWAMAPLDSLGHILSIHPKITA